MINFEDPLYRQCPFPGMRPFEAADARYFCGRDRHVRGVIDRLRTHCFVVVCGGSGSGKSSLVRAGIIPHLQTNGLERPGQVWIIAICKPGQKPLESLSYALAETLSTSDRNNSAQRLLKDLEGWPDISAFLDLYRDRLDVTRDYDDAGFPQICEFTPEEIATRRQRANLLLLVDQFEEIFADEVVTDVRTRRLVELVSPDSEASVKSRLEKRVFTIATMRSENLRSLGAFPILPELFNQTQYYLGPLLGPEIQAAIESPVQKCARQLRRMELSEPLPGSIAVESGLLDCMVQGALALQHDPDHLFLVQHAARSVWLRAAERWGATKDNRSGMVLTTGDYAALAAPVPLDAKQVRPDICAAALVRTLNNSAETAFDSLAREGCAADRRIQQRLARWLFKLLAIRDESGWATRRRTSRTEVLKVAGAEDSSLARHDALDEVIARFRDPHPFVREDERSDRLNEKPTLDVAHEALIRKWDRFVAWVDKEAESARFYHVLCQNAQSRSRDGLLEKSKLAHALEWRNNEKPTALWAQRYPGNFAAAMAFLEDSKREAERIKEEADAEAQRKQEEAAEKLIAEERQAAEKLRDEDRQATAKRELIRMRRALAASVLAISTFAAASAVIFYQYHKINKLNRLITSTNELSLPLALARDHKPGINMAPPFIQFRRLTQIDQMLTRLDANIIEQHPYVSSDDRNSFSGETIEAMKNYHFMLRLASQTVDEAARATLNSLWPMTHDSSVSAKPINISTEGQRIPTCLAKEIERRRIAVHSLRVFDKDGASPWHVALEYSLQTGEDVSSRRNAKAM